LPEHYRLAMWAHPTSIPMSIGVHVSRFAASMTNS
jgi:hypothetical protein